MKLHSRKPPPNKRMQPTCYCPVYQLYFASQSESPTKMILELDPSWKAETSKTYAQSIKRGRGCLGYFALAFVLILAIVGYYFSTNSLGSLPWDFWVLAVIVLVGGVIFTFIEVAFESSRKNDVQEVMVTIDLDPQQAVRVEKLNSGKTKQHELIKCCLEWAAYYASVRWLVFGKE